MTYRVDFSPASEGDLEGIYDYIAEQSPQRALSFVLEIRQRCERLADAPKVGTLRTDIAPNLRVIGFRRRVATGFQVTGDTVRIVRILYGGRDLQAALGEAE